MFKNIKNKKEKIFIITWTVITVIIVLIALTARVGFYDTAVINAKIDELKGNPQLTSAIQQWRKQGISELQIKKQLEKIAVEQAGASVAINVLKKQSFRAALIAIIAFVIFYVIFSNDKIFNRRKMSFAIAIICLLLFDQVYIANKYVMEEPVDITLQKPDAIAKLQTAKKPFRVSVVDKGAYNLWVTSLFKLNGVECIDVPADSRPSPIRKMFFYSNAISPVKRWQYSNVKYVLGPQRGLEMYLQQLGARKDFSVFYTFNLGNQRHAIYEYKKTLPRVFAVGNWTVITNAESAIAFMNNPENDPHKIAVITQSEIVEKHNTNFSGNVVIKKYSPIKIETDVELSARALVAMATETDGNWKILIDGKPAEIVKCNLLHFGAFVPKGKHSVIFYYDKKTAAITKVTQTAYLFLPVLLVITIILLIFKRSR